MKLSICGLDCDICEFKEKCNGCEAVGEKCVIINCCRSKGIERCSCPSCDFQTKLIDEFNALGINDMPVITSLNSLGGSFVNLEYTLANGQKVKFWDDDRVYFGNQVKKIGSDKCYGLAADENYLMVCEYGENGDDPEIVVYKRRG